MIASQIRSDVSLPSIKNKRIGHKTPFSPNKTDDRAVSLFEKFVQKERPWEESIQRMDNYSQSPRNPVTPVKKTAFDATCGIAGDGIASGPTWLSSPQSKPVARDEIPTNNERKSKSFRTVLFGDKFWVSSWIAIPDNAIKMRVNMQIQLNTWIFEQKFDWQFYIEFLR